MLSKILLPVTVIILRLLSPHSNNKIGENGVDILERKLRVVDHFTSLSKQERQRNVSKCKTHVQGVQSYCFLLIKPIGRVFKTAVVSLNIFKSGLFEDFVKRLKNDTSFHG